MRTVLGGLAVLLAVLTSPWAAAQNIHEQDGVVVHYNAVPTTSLTPEVARQYGITRSASRALLNVAVQRRTDAPLPQAISASVTAAAVLPTGQRQSIALREVREGEAIYYLGEVRISHGDELRFELEVAPEGGGRPLQVRFSQTFFID